MLSGMSLLFQLQSSVTFPSVEAMMIVLPEEDGPNSLERSTLIVRMVPSTVISTFFMVTSPLSPFFGPEYNGIGDGRQGRGLVVLGIGMFHGNGWRTGVPGADLGTTSLLGPYSAIRFLKSSAQLKFWRGNGKRTSYERKGRRHPLNLSLEVNNHEWSFPYRPALLPSKREALTTRNLPLIRA